MQLRNESGRGGKEVGVGRRSGGEGTRVIIFNTRNRPERQAVQTRFVNHKAPAIIDFRFRTLDSVAHSSYPSTRRTRSHVSCRLENT